MADDLIGSAIIGHHGIEGGRVGIGVELEQEFLHRRTLHMVLEGRLPERYPTTAGLGKHT